MDENLFCGLKPVKVRKNGWIPIPRKYKQIFDEEADIYWCRKRAFNPIKPSDETKRDFGIPYIEINTEGRGTPAETRNRKINVGFYAKRGLEGVVVGMDDCLGFFTEKSFREYQEMNSEFLKKFHEGY